MKRDTSPAPANTPATCKCCCDCHTSRKTCIDVTRSDISPVTPIRASKFLEVDTASPPPKSSGSHDGPNSSCKRRRLTPENENINGARILVYEKNESETDDSDNENPIAKEKMRIRQETILRKIRRLNYGDNDEQLLHSAGFSKLFEYVKDFDVVARKWLITPTRYDHETQKIVPKKDNVAGSWVYRGSGNVKFIKCLEEGYNFGMIKMELTKNGTLETLMCHELTGEEVNIYIRYFFILSLFPYSIGPCVWYQTIFCTLP